MIGWLWTSVAMADPPTELVKLWTISADGQQVERMAVSEGGDLVVGRTRGDLQAFLLDVDGWQMQVFGGASEGCDVTGVAPVYVDIEGEDPRWEVWTSCGDGHLEAQAYIGGDLEPVLDAEGNPLEIEPIDETLSGIWYHPPSQLLYTLSVAPEGVTEPAVLHVIDPYTWAYDSAVLGGYPVTLPYAGFLEGVIVADQLLIAHGGASMSQLVLGQANPAAIPDASAPAFQCDDLASTPYGYAYCVDASGSDTLGSAYQYNLVTHLFTPLPLGTLNEPAAVCVNNDPTDGWLAITGGQVKVWRLTDSGALADDVNDPYFAGDPDAENPIQDMVTDDGYLYGGGEEGNLHVVTSRPWLEPARMSAVPASLAGGQISTLTFDVDEDADYTVYLGGDRTGSGGKELASGTAQGSTPQELHPVIVEIEIDGDYAEGDNHVYVIATSELTGLTGHGRVTLDVDNPPQPPVLTDGNVQFSDNALVLSFDGIPDEDLDFYEIYVSDAPFVAGDFPTGGPETPEVDGLKTPIRVDSEGGLRVSHRIAPLTNDVTYYIGVRATDEGGKEGPMSRVVKGTPQKTYTAAELAGDPGGTPCSTGLGSAGLSSLGWLGTVLGGLVLTRRRSGRSAALGGLVLLGAVSSTARAQDDDDDPWWRQDTTPARANFEIRYGGIALKDERIDMIYRDHAHNLLMAEVGPQLFRYAEVDFGFGFYQELAKTTTKDGKLQSGDVTMLTWFPLSIDVTGRAHVLDEQPAVPYFRYGWDYVLWSEKSDNGLGGKDITRGGKFGTHMGLGVDLLLDLVSPGRASFLEAQTGINDSWLTIEWRRQRVDARTRPWTGRSAPPDRLDFSGDALLIGLKLDW
jgi:hypothetical protein